MSRTTPSRPRRALATLVIGALASVARSAEPYRAPIPGSPSSLTDWRWLARPARGRQVVRADPWGKQKLAASDDGFLILDTRGPGVLEHLWTTRGDAPISIVVDGQQLWKGALRDALRAPEEGQPPSLFPTPLVFGNGGMYHLLAPIGFQGSLRILTDRQTFPCYLSCRTLNSRTLALPATVSPDGEYASGLRAAAKVWSVGGCNFSPAPAPAAIEVRTELVLPPGGRAAALNLLGSGEITRLELHMTPPLVGSLRHVVAELFYDGVKTPSIRLPITDLVGLPHPWPCGRWDGYNGDLAGGIRYPWELRQPRVHYREATFHLNLPTPYARGLRMELTNRSTEIRFMGSACAIVRPLSAQEAQQAGRLCATRVISRVPVGKALQPLIRIAGPGQLVGLAHYMTGNEQHYPPAVRKYIAALTVDEGQPITGPGLMPLWFQGIYGGPVVGMPIWNHPRYEHNYAGVTRHFLTDPVSFTKAATFSFTVGTDIRGAPTNASTLAFWYRFGNEPYEAPPLPDTAERLPYSTYGSGRGPKGSRLFRAIEAEDLVPMSVAHDAKARSVEDVDHNYHPSKGQYLHVVANRPGGYVDCLVPFPASRYFAVGTLALGGPNRGDFEVSVLSRAQAKSPPTFLQGDAFYRGRILGSVPMSARIFMGHFLSHRRDPSAEFPPPFFNPAPDDDGIIRFICRSKRQSSRAYLMKLDQIRLDMPPPNVLGWHEFEELPPPEVRGGLSATLPKYGRFEWSGWGAVALTTRSLGWAIFSALVPVGKGKPSGLVVKGSLGPGQGHWLATVGHSDKPITLSPGKDDREIREWSLRVPRLDLPGRMTISFVCVGFGDGEENAAGKRQAQLILDAWTIQYE